VYYATASNNVNLGTLVPYSILNVYRPPNLIIEFKEVGEIEAMYKKQGFYCGESIETIQSETPKNGNETIFNSCRSVTSS
jgi:hypothetical protein